MNIVQSLTACVAACALQNRGDMWACL